MSPYHAILGDGLRHAAPTRPPGARGATQCRRHVRHRSRDAPPCSHADRVDEVASRWKLCAGRPARGLRPGAGEAEPLTLRWERRIGRTALSTRQHADCGFLVEESGPGRMVFSLRAADGCLLYEHAALRFLFLRVPPVLAPCVRARVSPDPEGWRVDVSVEWHGHLICWYGGRMRPSQEAA